MVGTSTDKKEVTGSLNIMKKTVVVTVNGKPSDDTWVLN